MEPPRLPEVFLMSYPRPDWGIKGKANFLSSDSSDASPRQAFADWLAVAQAIEDAGGEVLVLPPPPRINLTGLPYTAEAGMFFFDSDDHPAFILPNMKPKHRKAEALYIAGYINALGLRITPCSSQWEAQGDALRLDDRRMIHTYGIGAMARTHASSYNEVSPLLSPEHIQLRFKAEPWFHGNTFIAPFWRADTRTQPIIMVCPDALFDGELERLRNFDTALNIVEIERKNSVSYATNALQVGNTIIAPSGLPKTIHTVWQQLGLTIAELPLPELFRRGGGAAVCLTNRMHGLDPSTLPKQLLFRSQAKALRAKLTHYPK